MIDNQASYTKMEFLWPPTSTEGLEFQQNHNRNFLVKVPVLDNQRFLREIWSCWLTDSKQFLKNIYNIDISKSIR